MERVCHEAWQDIFDPKDNETSATWGFEEKYRVTPEGFLCNSVIRAVRVYRPLISRIAWKPGYKKAQTDEEGAAWRHGPNRKCTKNVLLQATDIYNPSRRCHSSPTMFGH